jgi:hypothetical protein
MTRYKAVEITNQQAPIDATHQPLTPRIELVQGKDVFTSLADLAADMTVEGEAQRVRVTARGRLLTPEGRAPDTAVTYTLDYELTPSGLVLIATVLGLGPGQVARLIAPIIARRNEATAQPDARSFLISREAGRILARSAEHDFEPLVVPRIFNLVPGFQAAPLTIALTDGQAVRFEVSAQT